jgi:hypothetical protein
MMGTKTPLLSFIITIGFTIGYIWAHWVKKKEYKKVGISLSIIIIGLVGLWIILPKTNFYKNIETHLEFLEIDSIEEIFRDRETLDHFIFSQRLTFLNRKAKLYHKANTYQKLFGIGYLKKNGKATKMIEMDYFDIFYSHGIVGFLVFFIITIYLVYKIFRKRKEFSYERYMNDLSFLLIIVLSFFTGHILTAPAVSIVVTILLLNLYRQDNKRILLVGDVKLQKKVKNLEVYRQDPIDSKLQFLVFKILNYKNYDYGYSKDKNNNLIEVAANQILTKKEMQEL